MVTNIPLCRRFVILRNPEQKTFISEKRNIIIFFFRHPLPLHGTRPCGPVPQCRDRSRRGDRQRDESHFVNSPWLQHSPCRLLLEGDFSASRCLPAGYASLLRNTSVSHTSCGQAHRSVLSERVSKTARVGLAVANKQRIEGSAALCAALLELRLIRYEAISEQASVSCERSHQRPH